MKTPELSEPKSYLPEYKSKSSDVNEREPKWEKSRTKLGNPTSGGTERQLGHAAGNNPNRGF